MKAVSARVTKGINIGSYVNVADNSGAIIAKIVAVYRGKSRKRRMVACGVADKVKVSIREGTPEMKKQLFDAVVIRQKKEYRRLTGERISFADNAVAILKDDINPKGTVIKGPVAREVVERWPEVAKIASVIV